MRHSHLGLPILLLVWPMLASADDTLPERILRGVIGGLIGSEPTREEPRDLTPPVPARARGPITDAINFSRFGNCGQLGPSDLEVALATVPISKEALPLALDDDSHVIRGCSRDVRYNLCVDEGLALVLTSVNPVSLKPFGALVGAVTATAATGDLRSARPGASEGSKVIGRLDTAGKAVDYERCKDRVAQLDRVSRHLERTGGVSRPTPASVDAFFRDNSSNIPPEERQAFELMKQFSADMRAQASRYQEMGR